MNLSAIVLPRDENIPSVVWVMGADFGCGARGEIGGFYYFSLLSPIAFVETFVCSTARGRARKPQLLWFWS